MSIGGGYAGWPFAPFVARTEISLRSADHLQTLRLLAGYVEAAGAPACQANLFPLIFPPEL